MVSQPFRASTIICTIIWKVLHLFIDRTHTETHELAYTCTHMCMIMPPDIWVLEVNVQQRTSRATEFHLVQWIVGTLHAQTQEARLIGKQVCVQACAHTHTIIIRILEFEYYCKPQYTSGALPRPNDSNALRHRV